MSTQLELPFPPEYVEITLNKRGQHAGKFKAIVDYEDRDLASFVWSVFKKGNTVYANRRETVNGKIVIVHLHRIILERKIGRRLESYELVDHINRDGRNNTRDNLRLATQSQNLANRHTRSPYGYKGVSWEKRRHKWLAQIGFNYKSIFIGYFDTPEEAHEAYCRKADELFGEFANYGSNST